MMVPECAKEQVTGFVQGCATPRMNFEEVRRRTSASPRLHARYFLKGSFICFPPSSFLHFFTSAHSHTLLFEASHTFLLTTLKKNIEMDLVPHIFHEQVTHT